jgi:predicted methyltransferase
MTDNIVLDLDNRIIEFVNHQSDHQEHLNKNETLCKQLQAGCVTSAGRSRHKETIHPLYSI